MNNNINKEVITLPPFKRFCMTIGQLPSSYVETMTYYEAVTWLANYLEKTVIPAVNNNGEAVTELQYYVQHYFDNLDVTEEINNKLDEMAEDGTLTNLIKGYVDPLIRDQNDVIANFKNEVNATVGQISETVDHFDDKLDAATNGAPLAASSTSDMTDTSKIYVNTTDGYWYYYNGEAWQQGGVYQSSVNTDDVDYLLNRDTTSNPSNFDILSNILLLSQYTSVNKKSLANLINASTNGISANVIGLNEIKLTGTATADGIIKISNKITLKANTAYTLAVLDYSGNSSIYTYFYESGTTNSYKDSTNTAVRVELNTATQNNVKNFTAAASDKDVEVGVYTGNGTTRNHSYRVIVLEGTYSVSDIKTASNLSQTLQNRKFVKTTTSSEIIPTYKTPVFYLASGPGPFTNFGSNTVYKTTDYLLIYNSLQNLDTWQIVKLPLLKDNTIKNDSIKTVTPESNIRLNSGELNWVIASTAGTYTNFIGYNGSPLTLNDGEVAIFRSGTDLTHDPVNYWTKDVIPNVDTTLSSDIETYVTGWLNDHPEATTTVVDGSITLQKLDTSLANKANRVRVDSNTSATYEPNRNDLNTVVGANNMANGIGSRNTIVGIDNLQANSSGHSANYEIAVGYHSLFRDWDGDHNVSVGNEAMDNVSHGSYNTAIGSNALRSQKVADYGGTGVEGETANYNTSVGGSAMYYTYGDNNTAVGHEALRGITYGATGSNNVAIGNCAGKYNTNESNKLFIDDRDRGSRTNENSKALIVGTFDDDPANQEIKINGKFGCNGATPQASVLAAANASDLQSAITLLNQIKQVLIDNGILK